jgi:hypothetical protein
MDPRLIYLAMKILANVGEEQATHDEWLEFAIKTRELLIKLGLQSHFDIYNIPYVATSFLHYVYHCCKDSALQVKIQVFLTTHGVKSMNEPDFVAFFNSANWLQLITRHSIVMDLDAFINKWPSRMETMLDNEPAHEPVSFYTKADDEEWKKEFNWDK